MITRVDPSAVGLEMVSTYGVHGQFPPGILFQGTTQAAAARTEYYALDIPAVMVVKRFWWANGPTGSLVNIIMALYRDNGFKPGARIATTAATAQSAASVIQFASPSGGDFTISPGLYWLAIAASTAAGAPTLFGSALSAQTNFAGAFQEATVTPPATATVTEKTSTSYYVCGFSTTTLV